MSSKNDITPVSSQKLSRGIKAIAIIAVSTLTLAGCSAEVKRGWLPADSTNATNHTNSITELWVNSWITLLIIGVFTWGLMLWCVVVYRRKKGEKGYPRQTTYNLPLEVFYTVIPLLFVIVFYVYTDRTMQSITQKPGQPQVVIDAYGKQWSWDFNYTNENTYSQGVQVDLDGKTGARDRAPVLYLPVNQSVEVKLHSRDVIHSFWIPAFLQKQDMIPGAPSSIYFTPTKEGTFDGKCAELCGEFHSEMLFRVAVVDQATFNQKMQELKNQGNVGQVGDQYNRNGSGIDGDELDTKVGE
ncbi:MAG: cytochrome c oxidase subunit II [Micrococcaceae bacterium]